LGLAFLVFAGVLRAGTAEANDKAAAQQSARDGSLKFDLGKYRPALEAFQRAYFDDDDPKYLFHIAQCYLHLDEKVEAVRFYKLYLKEVPGAPNREGI